MRLLYNINNNNKRPKFGEKHQHTELAEIPIRYQSEDIKVIVNWIYESEVHVGTGVTNLRVII